MAERLTEAMARSLHVSRERALGFEKRQGRLTEIGNRLESQIGDASGGGVWMRKGANGIQDLVVNLTTPSLFPMVRGEGARPRLVPRSLRELKRVDGELEAEAQRESPGGSASWYVDREEDVVRLQVSRSGLGSAGMEGLLGRARELGAAVRTEIGDFEAPQPQADEEVIGGTLACIKQPLWTLCNHTKYLTSYCTLGPMVTHTSDRQTFVLTASHCATDPANWSRAKWYNDRGVWVGQVRAYNNDPHDWALISFDGQATPTNKVLFSTPRNSPLTRPVTQIGPAATQGSEVCNASWNGVHCGELTAIDARIGTLNDIHGNGMRFRQLNRVTGACTVGRTSGMPWVIPDATGRWLAEGIHAAGRGERKLNGKSVCAGEVPGHTNEEHWAVYTSMDMFMHDTNSAYTLYTGD